MRDQIVLITGASSGIGAACARSLGAAGAKLVLVARRQERLQALKEELEREFALPVHTVVLDVRSSEAVEQAMADLPPSWSAIDILINNAGLSRGLDPLPAGQIQDWEEMIDTNIKGLLYVTRALVPGMIRRGRGHVVNIGSLAGYDTYPRGNVYCATKAAVRVLSTGLRQDLLGTPVKVSCVNPGLVETEFSQVRFKGDDLKAKQPYVGLTPLEAEDVAEVVLFCLTRPPHVNIPEILVLPRDQAGSQLVHRRPVV